MPRLVINDVPEGLHRRLRELARETGRNVNQQVISLLAEALRSKTASTLPPPLKGRFPLDSVFLETAKRFGRSWLT